MGKRNRPSRRPRRARPPRSLGIARLARWPRPLGALLPGLLLVPVASLWTPALIALGALWGLFAAAVLLDARLRGRVGLLATVFAVVLGPLGVALIGLARRRDVRKVTDLYRGAPLHAAAVGVLSGLAVVSVGISTLDRLGYATRVPGRDMGARLAEGDVIVVLPVLHGMPDRTDLVAVGDFAPARRILDRTGRTSAVLRVVGLPNEWIGAASTGEVYICPKIPDVNADLGNPDVHARFIAQGCVFPDETPYLESTTAAFGPLRVPADAVYLLGDDRAVGDDSRSFGSVPVAALAGPVGATLWPPERIAVR